MHLLKVVLYMLRPKSSKSKSFQNTAVSSFSWKGLVGSMRPMHLQSNQSPPPSMEAKPAIMLEPQSMPVGEQNEEAVNPPLSTQAFVSIQSPASSISACSSEIDSDLSQYESPLNQEIHIIKPCGEITEDECCYDEDAGDEMIDAKAEEFIAQFYEQIRLQNLNLS